MNYITRLHKNLGHPGSEVLVRMLEEVQATEATITAAREYVCPICYSRRKPAGVPPAAGLMAKNFGDRVFADSAWIEVKGGRRCVLTIMDQATRYVAVRLLESEKSTDLVKGVERAWIKQFGVPKFLRIDEAKGWAAAVLRDWASQHNVTLEIAPAECHNWLGSVERKHQVVRRALEIYMDAKGERNLSNLKEALVYTPGQVNQLSFTRDFTPEQWVTGRTPMSTTSLSADLWNPGADPMDEPTTFAETQRRRLDAQRAFLQADCDARLRRAMNKLYRENHDDVAVGQKVWFWRVQGTGILQKQKWRDPARVVALEHNDEGKTIVIWVAHGTNLLRCGPHQVHPLVADTGCAPIADPAAALSVIEVEPVDEEPPDLDHLEYEPSLPDGNVSMRGHDSDADDERFLDHYPSIPGAASLLFQEMEERTRHQRRRLSSSSVPGPPTLRQMVLLRRPFLLSPRRRRLPVARTQHRIQLKGFRSRAAQGVPRGLEHHRRRDRDG